MPLLGFHVEGKTLKVAILSQDKQSIEIEHLDTYLLENLSCENVNQLYNHPSLHSHKKLTVVSGLESSDIILREIDFGLHSKKAILKALPFQLDGILPIPVEELIVLPFLERIKKDKTQAFLLAASQSSVQNHLKKCEDICIEPEHISCIPAALKRFAHFCYPDRKDFFLFHFGLQKISYALVLDNQLHLSQTHPCGLQDFFDALMEDLPGKTIEEIHDQATKIDLFCLDALPLPKLKALAQQFQKDLDRISTFLQKKFPMESFPHCFYTGTLAPFFNLKSFLEKYLGPSLPEPSGLNVKTDFSVLQSYAIPVGLCLDVLKNDLDSAEFRRGPFEASSLSNRRQKKFFSYLALSITLTTLAWVSSHVILQKKEALILARLQSYLENYAHQKTAIEPPQIEKKLAAWETSLSKFKKPFPYVPSVPGVSDLLAWISSHPKLNVSNSTGDEKTDRIEIRHVNYMLVKYPKIGENLEPYQAKAEIEFTSDSPRLAREFHETLLEGDEIVNPKSEITWNVNQNTYRTAFFLKSQNKRSPL